MSLTKQYQILSGALGGYGRGATVTIQAQDRADLDRTLSLIKAGIKDRP